MVKVTSINRRAISRKTVRQPVSRHVEDMIPNDAARILPNLQAELSYLKLSYQDLEEKIDRLLTQLEEKNHEIFLLKEAAKWAAKVRDEDRNHNVETFEQLCQSEERERELQRQMDDYEEIFEDIPVSPKDILRVKSPKTVKKDERVRSMMTPFDGKKKNNKKGEW